MKIAKSILELRSIVNSLSRDIKIGFVPTMGYLHAGHTSLVSKACKRNSFPTVFQISNFTNFQYTKYLENDFVVASIFVNPTKFGPKEDFGTYPRNLENDVKLLQNEGCDLLFHPKTDELFSSNFNTWVSVDTINDTFEAKSRSNHFKGVTTIVAKLFNIVQPTTKYCQLTLYFQF